MNPSNSLINYLSEGIAKALDLLIEVLEIADSDALENDLEPVLDALIAVHNLTLESAAASDGIRIGNN